MRDVARAYETAVTFRDEDQAARDAESRIRQELRERYDVEVLETGADPAVGRATLVDRDAERVERDERQAQARDDQALAAGLVVGAEVLEVSADLVMPMFHDLASARGSGLIRSSTRFGGFAPCAAPASCPGVCDPTNESVSSVLPLSTTMIS